MGLSIRQGNQSLHNQWTLLTIKTEKRQKCKPTSWHTFTLKVIRMAGSLRVFAKPTACLSPSGVMKESIISTPSWGKQRKRGREAGGRQSAPLYGQKTGSGVLLQWWTVQHTDPSLPRSLSTSHCTEAYAHTCIACSHLQPLNAEEHCLNVIATAPILPNLTFKMCCLCYKELFACVL